METKICTQCREEKNISEYSKNPDRKSGYLSKCKSCKCLNAKIYRDNNKDKVVKKNKLYRLKSKDEIRVKLTAEEKRKRASEYTSKYISNRSKNDPIFRG